MIIETNMRSSLLFEEGLSTANEKQEEAKLLRQRNNVSALTKPVTLGRYQGLF